MLDTGDLQILAHQNEEALSALIDLALLTGLIEQENATHLVGKWQYSKRGRSMRVLCYCSGKKIGEIIARLHNARSAYMSRGYGTEELLDDGWEVFRVSDL